MGYCVAGIIYRNSLNIIVNIINYFSQIIYIIYAILLITQNSSISYYLSNTIPHTPLISHHSSHNTHITPLISRKKISHQSSHKSHIINTYFTIFIIQPITLYNFSSPQLSRIIHLISFIYHELFLTSFISNHLSYNILLSYNTHHINKHSSYTTYLSSLISQHSSCNTHHTPLISQHSSRTIHFTPLISQHSSHTIDLWPIISQYSILHYSSYTIHLLARSNIRYLSYTIHFIPNANSDERCKISYRGLSGPHLIAFHFLIIHLP